jgi:hypothetical protein
MKNNEWEPHAEAIANFMDEMASGVEDDMQRKEARRGELVNARMYQRRQLPPDRARRSIAVRSRRAA